MILDLYHYYEEDQGPFKNLSSLEINEAEEILQKLRCEGDTFASKRSLDYLRIRRELESKARESFINKGGKPKNLYPQYMTLGACEWIREWFKNGRHIQIPLAKFKEDSISFTYGDLFPTMRYQDGREYRGQVYTISEINELLNKYGLPQVWNREGNQGPERYIEVQIWNDEVIKKYRHM
ncbi:hypothetical protein [Paenibacillus rigui]|uniref:Uncharacterized protein n=1 Tax=Paenibacillus rigui TaxID=554312 RepID=A0A229UGM5_9BACL|nr:hypothetical protein [Paenibacillus rigui]OXM82511.1 hypothetical protein CF651_30585 [Paenibacillus rigui]